MFCSRCGASLKEEDIFCSTCGTRAKTLGEAEKFSSPRPAPASTASGSKTDCPACGIPKASAEEPCDVCGFRPVSSRASGAAEPERTPHGTQGAAGRDAPRSQAPDQRTSGAPSPSPSEVHGVGGSVPRPTFFGKWIARQLEGYSTLPWYETARGDMAVYGFCLAGVFGYGAYHHFIVQPSTLAVPLSVAALVVALVAFLGGRGNKLAMVALALLAILGMLLGLRVLGETPSHPIAKNYQNAAFAAVVGGPFVVFLVGRALYVERRRATAWFFD